MINSSTDIQSLAYQFVQADRASQDEYFAGRKSSFQSRIKAYNSISEKVNALKTTLSDMARNKQFEAYSVTQSAEGFAKITAGVNTAPGQYQINIDRMASTHQVALNFSSETELMPTSGMLTLGSGSDSMTIDMSSLKAGATLTDLRDAINAASDNPGVRASLIRSGTSVKLLLSSEDTGLANQLTLSTDGDPSLTSFVSEFSNPANTISQAQDALIRLGGTLELTSSTNSFKNVIDGLTIDISKTHAPGETLTFTVGRNMDATKEQLQKLVDGYNAIVNTISSQNDAKTLSGDNVSRQILQQMRATLSEFNLSELGLGYDRNGKLTLNSTKLNEYLTANPEGLTTVMGGDTGLVKKLTTRLDSFTKGNSALITGARNTVQSNLNRLQDRMDRFDERMEKVYQRYVNQFSQMQSLIMQMQQTFGQF